MMWYWGGGGIHWWSWTFVILATLVFWAIVVAGIAYLVKVLARERRPPSTRREASDSAEQVLARRFAAGEIEEEEFRRRLDAVRAASLGRDDPVP